MWITQVPLQILGESNLSYRILDSTLGILLLYLCIIFSNKLFLSYYPGIFAGFVLLLSKELIWGAHGFRKGTQDDLLLTLLTVSYILLWNILESKKDIAKQDVYLCLTIGLSCLTKSVAGFLPLTIYALYILASNKMLGEKIKHILKLSFLSLILPSIYYIYHCIQSPVAWKKFFYIELYERAVKGMHHKGETYFYLKELFLKHSFTYPKITIVALLIALYLTVRKKDSRIVYLLLLSVVPVFIFSLPNSRLPWYIFPSYVPLSLLIGFTLWQSFSNLNSSKHWGLKVLSASFILITFYYSIPRTHKVGSYYLSLNAKQQLTIDKLVHTILSNPNLKLYVDPTLVDTRALAGRRKTNRDGFYWTMIHNRLSPTLDFEEGLVILPKSMEAEINKLKPNVSAHQILPKARTRKETSLILKLGKAELKNTGWLNTSSEFP